ncbi:eukaryotic integral membrane protein-domain-containing protein [Phycomyces nitens]|nr:eukaryotic integral membrane protein-domain-containing protein [Phycomyces nitens]
MSSNPLLNAIGNVPILTKSLVSILLIISTAATFYIHNKPQDALDVCPILGLVPGMALYRPWTFLTAAFYESNIFSLLASMVVLLLCGKYLERAWGSRELLKYIIITAILSNVVTWFGLVVTFYISADDKLLYTTQICGMSGVFSAFLVAFKHLIPEHRISLAGGLVSIRVKNLLGVATLVSIICLVAFQAIVFYNLVNIGWVIGWIYIRFFKYQDGVRGDHSETFALVTFFPEFIHPVIRLVGIPVYGLFVRLGVCPVHVKDETYDLEDQAGTRPGASAEAERRRALALKALDIRLSSKPAAPEVLFDAQAAVPALQAEEQAPETKRD